MSKTVYNSDGTLLINDTISVRMPGSDFTLRRGRSTRSVRRGFNYRLVIGVISMIDTTTTAKSSQFHRSRR